MADKEWRKRGQRRTKKGKEEENQVIEVKEDDVGIKEKEQELQMQQSK